jgi:hypothetical protein
MIWFKWTNVCYLKTPRDGTRDKGKSCVKVLIYVAYLPTVGYGTMLNNVAHCQCV